MSGIKINQETLSNIAAKLDVKEPVTMLNMIRFYSKPQYSPDTKHDLDTNDNVSGQETYMTRYLPAWQAVMERYGGFEVKFLSTNTMGIISVENDSDRPWDVIGVIQYRKLQDFIDLIGDSEYLAKAEPHRLATIEQWNLVACV